MLGHKYHSTNKDILVNQLALFIPKFLTSEYLKTSGRKRKQVQSGPSFIFFTFTFKFKTFLLVQLYCPDGISPMGNLGCLSQGKPEATQPRYPTYCTCCFTVFHNPQNSGMDSGIFNMHTDVNARDCTWGGIWTP